MESVVRHCSVSWEGTYPSLCWHADVCLLSSLVVCRGGSSPEHPAPGLLIFFCGCTLALAGLQHQFVEGPSGLLESPAALPVALPTALSVALPVALLVHQHLSLVAPAHIWTVFFSEYSCAIGVGRQVPLCVQSMHAAGSAH